VFSRRLSSVIESAAVIPVGLLLLLLGYPTCGHRPQRACGCAGNQRRLGA
jgi:hypothetical protein